MKGKQTPRARARARTETLPETLRSRVRIENVRPSVDGGRYPIKRTAGEPVAVSADVFADGHDRLRVRLVHRQSGSDEWLGLFMDDMGNDVWQASFEVLAMGRHEYRVEAWID